jgi:hypothetical protein
MAQQSLLFHGRLAIPPLKQSSAKSSHRLFRSAKYGHDTSCPRASPRALLFSSSPTPLSSRLYKLTRIRARSFPAYVSQASICEIRRCLTHGRPSQNRAGNCSISKKNEENMDISSKKKCAHPPCICQVQPHERYCSIECEAMEDTPDLACECHHPACEGNVGT